MKDCLEYGSIRGKLAGAEGQAQDAVAFSRGNFKKDSRRWLDSLHVCANEPFNRYKKCEENLRVDAGNFAESTKRSEA